jgi:tRNA threonylcarbamoyladenosine biosynthesis protein TsaB
LEPKRVSRSQGARRILGIETSTSHCQVALAEDRSILATAQLQSGARPTATLVPTIRDLAEQIGWSLRDLDLVAVDIGPGSYTGLRVGLTCAKTLAFAAGAAMAAVGSLDVVAQNIVGDEPMLDVGFDAARGQVFAAPFRRLARSQIWMPMEPVRIVEAEQWVRSLDPSALVLGPALLKHRRLIEGARRVANESEWWPKAANVIELGLRQFQSGELPSYWALEPIYLRLSAAEEKKFLQRPE